jgi:16S rRNA (cytosine967-C5)-methyltransferase
MARSRLPGRTGARILPSAVDGASGGARAAAAWVLERTLGARSPVDTFLDGAQAPLDERDQSLLRELVLGSLRWLRRLDGVILAASNRPLEEIDPRLLPLLRVAAYQLLFLDRVPAHAAVNEAVEQATHLTHRGGASFVNAVLRRIARSPKLAAWPVAEREPVQRLAAEKSHPDFLVARWVERFGLARTAQLLDANNRMKPLQLLAFRDRGGREALAEALIDEGVDVEPSTISPLGLSVRSGNPFTTAAFARGLFYVQDEASQAAALVPPPGPGDRVLDAAAAPGGKTFALQAYEPTLRVIAADLSLPRALILRANASRLGRVVPLLVSDAAAAGLRGGFDRVVLDLPCTGTGTLRKNPELKWRISESEIGRLAAQAGRMLDGGAPLVRVGGLLVAVTCSLEAEENEQVIERFLGATPGFAPVDLSAALGSPADRAVAGPGMWRLFPGGDHDGFTVHVVRRLY